VGLKIWQDGKELRTLEYKKVYLTIFISLERVALEKFGKFNIKRLKINMP